MACAIASQYDRARERKGNVHAGGWRGELALRFERRAERTVLAERRHFGPLVLQKTLYPEGESICHGIVLHPPGGLVGGDELRLDAHLATESSVLLTTPGATKWYRSSGAQARQTLRFTIEDGAALEWLPQPSILFDRASARSEVEIEIAGRGSYVGWELLCLGRTASGERFDRGCMMAGMRVTRAGHPLWIERAVIEGGARLLSSPAGLGGHPITGTLVAISRKIDAALIAACRAVVPIDGRCGITRLPGLLLARYLGDRSEPGQDYFVRLWHVLRPALLGRAAVNPRIWRT